MAFVSKVVALYIVNGLHDRICAGCGRGAGGGVQPGTLFLQVMRSINITLHSNGMIVKSYDFFSGTYEYDNIFILCINCRRWSGRCNLCVTDTQQITFFCWFLMKHDNLLSFSFLLYIYTDINSRISIVKHYFAVSFKNSDVEVYTQTWSFCDNYVHTLTPKKLNVI